MARIALHYKVRQSKCHENPSGKWTTPFYNELKKKESYWLKRNDVIEYYYNA